MHVFVTSVHSIFYCPALRIKYTYRWRNTLCKCGLKHRILFFAKTSHGISVGLLVHNGGNNNNNNNVFNSYRSTPRYIQCNLIYEKKRKFVQKRIQHGEWYNTTANCMLTDILSRMENAPSQPPSQPIHIARLRTTMPGTPETNRATRPTMHAKHNH